MSHDALWNTFVSEGNTAAAALEGTVVGIIRERLAGDELRIVLAQRAAVCFSIGYQSLLLGAEELGMLALACEQACDHLAAGQLAADAIPVLAAAANALSAAFVQLGNPDSSGARTASLPLEAARFELETFFPSAATAPAPDVPLSSLRRGPIRGNEASDGDSPPAAPSGTEISATAYPAKAAPTDSAPFSWSPTVDDDMLELYFDEARDRLGELSTKLLDLEQQPENSELLREIFRDLHTVKGSSAMVGLEPANRLAHAAEDLAGQVREGERTPNSAVVDALLAAVDALTEIVGQADTNRIVHVETAAVVKRLRSPEAAPLDTSRADTLLEHDAPDSHGAPDPHGAPAEVTANETTARQAQRAQRPQRRTRAERQTIRVDFDKLDRLMNLVGELVLGRDGLRGAVHSLSSISSELATDRSLSRRLAAARRDASISNQSAHEEAPERRARQSMLAEVGDELGRVERVLSDISAEFDYATRRIDSVSGELRDQVMKLRMVPISGVFRKHHRTVRDLAKTLGKRIELETFGVDTELDKLLVEALDEPLMHLVRNAVDHGIETPAERIAAGKPAAGSITLSARRQGNQIVITITDDGRGIDPDALRARALERKLLDPEELAALDDNQILDIIFRAGFSTANRVSDVSGRGVGMDVVKETIIRRLKGIIDISSELGTGSAFTLRLPLTLAIAQVLLTRTAGEVFAIPIDAVVRTLVCSNADIQLVQDREVLAVADRQIAVVRLDHVLELGSAPAAAPDELQIVLTEVAGETYGLATDYLMGKKEIVIKPLGDLLQNVPCAAGATLLGDRCAIILDVPAIVRRALQYQSGGSAGRGTGNRNAASTSSANTAPENSAPHVLLVEDSETVRESLRRLLTDAGYRVTTAIDGIEGLQAARREQFDLVSTDVMMPRMDGYELTRALRAMPNYEAAPIVMVTSRGERIDRVRGFDAGVDEYITKPHDRALLLRVVSRLLGEDVLR